MPIPTTRNALPSHRATIPVATAQFERLVSIPLSSTMSDADVDHVVDVVRDLTRRFRAVSGGPATATSTGRRSRDAVAPPRTAGASPGAATARLGRSSSATSSTPRRAPLACAKSSRPSWPPPIGRSSPRRTIGSGSCGSPTCWRPSGPSGTTTRSPRWMSTAGRRSSGRRPRAGCCGAWVAPTS